MKTTKRTRVRRQSTATRPTIAIDQVLVNDILATLDASEQLLDLLRGILNAGDEWWGDDLITTFMNRVIVPTRMQLALQLPKDAAPRVERRS